MAADRPGSEIPTTMAVHRIGGGEIANLRLKSSEQGLSPPGISVLLGGTADDAAEQMRHAFADPQKFGRLHEQARTVGTAMAEAIRMAGIAVIPNPSTKLPNHGRLIHPDGIAGFSKTNLALLSAIFQNKPTARE